MGVKGPSIDPDSARRAYNKIVTAGVSPSEYARTVWPRDYERDRVGALRRAQRHAVEEARRFAAKRGQPRPTTIDEAREQWLAQRDRGAKTIADLMATPDGVVTLAVTIMKAMTPQMQQETMDRLHALTVEDLEPAATPASARHREWIDGQVKGDKR